MKKICRSEDISMPCLLFNPRHFKRQSSELAAISSFLVLVKFAQFKSVNNINY